MDSACKAAQFQGSIQEQLVDASRREHEQRMSLAKALVEMLDTEREARMHEAIDIRMATKVEVSAVAAAINAGGSEAVKPCGDRVDTSSPSQGSCSPCRVSPACLGGAFGQDFLAQVASAAAAEVQRVADVARRDWEALNREMRELCNNLAEDLAAQRAEAERVCALQGQSPDGSENGLSAAARLKRTVSEMQARLQRQREACEEQEQTAKELQARSGGAVLAPAAPLLGRAASPTKTQAQAAPEVLTVSNFDGGGYM